MLGLKLLKKVGAKQIMVRGVSELIIKKIKGDYAAKHPILRDYRNDVLDSLQCFTEIDLQVMTRGQNILADGLATSTTTCKIPFCPTHKYTVEVKCRPTVTENIRYWQVFGNDDQIEDFLQCKNDFECINIDLEDDNDVVNKSVFESGSVNKADTEELNENKEYSGNLQLKNNELPRGLVPLEYLFDFNDVEKKKKLKLVVKKSKNVT
jgi:hypothetical protein